MKDLYVDDIGKGFPLILVHGFLGSSEMWCHQKNYFSKFCRVVTPALPGFGESNSIQSLDSIYKMAEIIINVIEKKNIDRFNLLGHSMGGMIAQEIVRIVSNRVNKLICFATGPIGEIPGRFETMDETRIKLKKEGINSFFERVPKKWFVKGEKDKNYYLCQKAIKDVTLETADNALVAMKNWSAIDNLKNINNETLIIWGDKDNSYNFNQVDTLHKKIKNSNLEIFKNCAHNVHLEKTDEFNNLVKKFIFQ